MSTATSTAVAGSPTVGWNLARQALVASLLAPTVVLLGWYGLPILEVVEVVVFLVALTALAVANVVWKNRWLQLSGGLGIAAFAALNIPFIGPELVRPDHYPTYFVAWMAVLSGVTGLVAGIAGFADAKRGRLGAPRWGGLAPAAILLALGFAAGTLAAALGMQMAPAPGTGTVALTPDAQVDASIEAFAYAPDPVRVARDTLTRLTLTNHDGEMHTFTVEGLGIDADVAPGKSVDVWLKPDEAGTFAIHCKPHSTPTDAGRDGMVGTLVVT